MTFDKLWSELCKKNPKLADGRKVEITVEQFKLALRQSHEAGVRIGQGSKSLFDNIFGGLR